jgi:hypothetical protein
VLDDLAAGVEAEDVDPGVVVVARPLLLFCSVVVTAALLGSLDEGLEVAGQSALDALQIAP